MAGRSMLLALLPGALCAAQIGNAFLALPDGGHADFGGLDDAVLKVWAPNRTMAENHADAASAPNKATQKELSVQEEMHAAEEDGDLLHDFSQLAESDAMASFLDIGRDVNRASRRAAQRRPRASVLASLLQELQTGDERAKRAA